MKSENNTIAANKTEKKLIRSKLSKIIAMTLAITLFLSTGALAIEDGESPLDDNLIVSESLIDGEPEGTEPPEEPESTEPPEEPEGTEPPEEPQENDLQEYTALTEDDWFGELITSEFSTMSGWTPEMPLPLRRLTPVELNAWNQHYNIAGIHPIELEILRLTNIERAKVGSPPVAINSRLFRAARFKSQEMQNLNYFSHTSPVYGYFTGIINLFYNWFTVSENIYAQTWQLAAADAVSGWMD